MFGLKIYVVVIYMILNCVVCIGQNDIYGQLRALADKAKWYSQQLNEEDRADSLSLEAMLLAESKMNDDYVLQAAMDYLNREEYGNPSIIDGEHYKRIAELEGRLTDPAKKFDLWVAFSKRLTHGNRTDQALKFSSQAMTYASTVEDPEIKVLANLASAKSKLAIRQIREAYRNLLNAENLLIHLDADCKNDLNHEIKEEICEFHYRIGNYRASRELKLSLIEELESMTPIDSTELMWSFFDLCEIAVRENPEIRIKNNMNSILSYCERTNNKLLQNFANAVYRGHLINNFRLEDYYRVYEPYYRQILSEDPAAINSPDYCLSNALFCEYETKIDSARAFFKTAIEAAKENGHEVRESNYLRRYGQFLLRKGEEKEAYATLQQALRLAEKHNYAPYILDITQALDSLARKYDEYQLAYHYSDLRLKKLSEVSNQQYNVNLLIMELENQKKQNSEELQLIEETEKRKNNIQYWAIGVGLIILFLTLIIVSSMSVRPWMIEMLSFFSILFVFEFVILILDNKIHHWAHGAPLKIFLVKIAILSVLFPLHHVIEKGVTTYMVKHQLVKRPKRSFFRTLLEKLYPWLDPEHDPESH